MPPWSIVLLGKERGATRLFPFFSPATIFFGSLFLHSDSTDLPKRARGRIRSIGEKGGETGRGNAGRWRGDECHLAFHPPSSLYDSLALLTSGSSSSAVNESASQVFGSNFQVGGPSARIVGGRSFPPPPQRTPKASSPPSSASSLVCSSLDRPPGRLLH